LLPSTCTVAPTAGGLVGSAVRKVVFTQVQVAALGRTTSRLQANEEA